VSLRHVIYIEYVRKLPRRKACAVLFGSRPAKAVFNTVTKNIRMLFVMKQDYGMNNQGRSKNNIDLFANVYKFKCHLNNLVLNKSATNSVF
jgi:hypothetical protein